MVTSPDGNVAARASERLRRVLESELPRDVKILGPAPSPLSRLRDQYRWHVLLKCGEHLQARTARQPAVDVQARAVLGGGSRHP